MFYVVEFALFLHVSGCRLRVAGFRLLGEAVAERIPDREDPNQTALESRPR